MLTENDVVDAVANHLRADGWRVESTSSTNKRGHDILVTKDGVTLAIEAKGETRQVVRVEEPGDLLPRFFRDAEAGVGAALASASLLGAEHHGAQDLKGAGGRAGHVPVGGVEPRGHVGGGDAVERHLAERGQNAGLQVDAHGPARGGFPVRFAAPQVLVREFTQRQGLLLALDVVGGVPARADAGEHVTGAAAGFGKLHLAVPGDDDAAAPALDTGLHDPNLPARLVDMQPKAGQGTRARVSFATDVSSAGGCSVRTIWRSSARSCACVMKSTGCASRRCGCSC